MNLNVGDIIKMNDGRLAVITVRRQYEARAHNDSWIDYRTEALFLTKKYTVNKSGHKITTTTDDVLRYNVAEVVGKADIEWKVDVSKIRIGE